MRINYRQKVKQNKCKGCTMRCALYFGSFNPLHKGHVAIARYVMENCNVDSVRLVLSPQSPFKDSTILQDPQLRLQELSRSIERFNAEYEVHVQTTAEAEQAATLCTGCNPQFHSVCQSATKSHKESGIKVKFLEISTVEFDLPRPNYTYNTLQHLKSIEPETTFLIVMGADNLAVIEKWYRGIDILKEFEVLVYPRKGFDTQALCNKYRATFLDAPLNDISSTMIREGEQNGKDMSHLRY